MPEQDDSRARQLAAIRQMIDSGQAAQACQELVMLMADSTPEQKEELDPLLRRATQAMRPAPPPPPVYQAPPPPVYAPPPPPPLAPPPPVKESPVQTWMIVAAVILIAGGLVYYFQFRDPSPPMQLIGDAKVNAKDGQRYVLIQPTSADGFQMGCNDKEDKECQPDEGTHPVVLTKAFFLGQTEVTTAAYKKFAKETGANMPPEPSLGPKTYNASWRRGRLPILSVTWDDADKYCKWAGGRLPTEAEWEFAARGGINAPRYAALDKAAWFSQNSGDEAIVLDQKAQLDPIVEEKLIKNDNHPHDAATKEPNLYNLYDMLGNAWEWTADWYGYFPSDKTTDPKGPEKGAVRVLRGGAWNENGIILRVSNRFKLDPSNKYNNVGFRCAADQMP